MAETETKRPQMGAHKVMDCAGEPVIEIDVWLNGGDAEDFLRRYVAWFASEFGGRDA